MEADRAVARRALFICTALTVLVTSSAGTSPLREPFWRRVCYLPHTEDI